MRERRIASKLYHPNVLPLKGFIKKSGQMYPSIVTEWMENGSLQEYMKENSVKNIEMVREIYKLL